MSQQLKLFKQRYYRNFNNLRLCRAVLISDNAQSELIAAREIFKQRYYWNICTLRFCRPELLEFYFQSEHIAAGESVQSTILSEQ